MRLSIEGLSVGRDFVGSRMVYSFRPKWFEFVRPAQYPRVLLRKRAVKAAASSYRAMAITGKTVDEQTNWTENPSQDTLYLGLVFYGLCSRRQ